MSKLALLQKIVKNLHKGPLENVPVTLEYLHALRLISAKFGPSGVVGIKVEGADAVDELAEAVFNDSQYQRGTTFAGVTNQLIDLIIFRHIAKPTVDPTDVTFIEQKINDWLREQIAPHEFYIPCFISPWPAPSFSIGPVRFTYVQEFTEAARAQTTAAIFDLTFGEVFQEMGRAAANWVATVQVDGCTKDRAREIADLAVDVALAGLQLCLDDRAKHMARMTGRTMPVFHHAISRSGDEVSSAAMNTQPGLGLGPHFLQRRLVEARSVLDSVGSRVQAFVTGRSPFKDLEQAWADAAYWFHEGLAEPLDTIAVPKLETALEVLLRSESTRGSKARVLKAIRAFYAKEPNDFINPHSQVTVEQFGQGFVRDRSRILHGTWSTLMHSFAGNRPTFTTLVREFLTLYTLALDQFAAASSPVDDVDVFLDFVDKQPRPPAESPQANERKAEDS